MTLLTGDNADNQQANEAHWVDQLLDGERVDPNSGHVDADSLTGAGCGLKSAADLAAEAPRYTGIQDYDDYVQTGSFYDPDQPYGGFAGFPAYPGLMDRAQLPFQATGLDVPSYIAAGNHDFLVQGNEASNAALNGVAMGCIKPLLPTLNPGDPAALLMQTMLNPTASMIVPPDRARHQITKAEYRQAFAGPGSSDAHGFGYVDQSELSASAGAASYYAFSPPRTATSTTRSTCG
jgi:hypothetical protein